MSGPTAYPLLVQIENTPESRPPTGLDAASVVFQYLVEYTITRFSALYHCVPGVVGNVRSARFISVYLYQRFGAYLMASGGSAYTYQRISQSGIPAIINDFDHGWHFFRWDGRPAPHNLYTRQDQMLAATSVNARPPRSTDFLRSNSWSSPEAAPVINVPAHNTQFVYGGGSYEVVTEGVGLGDTIFGAVRPTGVAVLHLRQWRVPSVVDVEGAPVMDYDTSSGGPAEMYANGTVIRGSWSAAGQEGVFELHDSNNQPVGMPPGLLWVSLAP